MGVQELNYLVQWIEEFKQEISDRWDIPIEAGKWNIIWFWQK